MPPSTNGTTAAGWEAYERVKERMNGHEGDSGSSSDPRNGDDDPSGGRDWRSETAGRAKEKQQDAWEDRRAAETAGWAWADLAAVESGDHSPVKPGLLHRVDQVALFYPGLLQCLFGTPGCAKTWMALEACRQALLRGEVVWFIDFENGVLSIVVDRLVGAMGVPWETVIGQFGYCRPDGAVNEAVIEQLLGEYAKEEPTLVVVDGVTAALAANGLDSNSSVDVARFHEPWRLLAEAGAAVALIDHITKDSRPEDLCPIGSQHKLAGVDLAYRLLPVHRFGRGLSGMSLVRECKDRPGHITALGEEAAYRRNPLDRVVAEMAIDDTAGDGRPVIELRPPGVDEVWNPTALMEKISRLLEEQGPLGVNAIRRALKGNETYRTKALEALVRDGYVKVEDKGKGKPKPHHSVKPYRSKDHIPGGEE